MPILTVLPSVRDRLDAHERQWRACEKCVMGRWVDHHVFVRGTVPCDILFVGEAPGRDESRLGYPFMGNSGGVLNKWLEKTSEDIEFTYAITNVVACRPSDSPNGPNRTPSEPEQARCFTRLEEFVRTIAQPKGIVLLGTIARSSDLAAITPLPNVVLTHPAYFLRNSHRIAYKRLQLEQLVSFIMEVMS